MTDIDRNASDCYLLCDWEANGYNDSDFFDAYYDAAHGDIFTRETDSTRYGGGAGSLTKRDIRQAAPEVLEGCRKAAAARILRAITIAETQDMQPRTAHIGDELKLNRSARNKGQAYPAGTVGRVFWQGAYGKFYRSGYNKPNRDNTRIGLELADGRKAFFALSACDRAKPMASTDELAAIAEKISYAPCVGAVVGCRAWLTTDYLSSALSALTGRPVTKGGAL